MSDLQSIWRRAEAILPGGVNSPVRALRSVDEEPLLIASAQGAYLNDRSGKRYLDYIGSWGPMILGHGDSDVIAAVEKALRRGFSFGLATADEVELAEVIRECFPSMEMLRLVNSGTEATMTALRVARGYTNRPYFLKFEGCYHGHADALLVKGGSGLATFHRETSGAATGSAPSSAGVTPQAVQHTLVAPFNDLPAVQKIMQHHGNEMAAIILEPVVGNMGLVPPQPGFLQGLRELCDRTGALLIFDEVMTGFRLSSGGAQKLYGIQPDMTTLGKIVSGGLPLAAYGGRRAIMQKVSPLGPGYQAGTLSGNPIAVASGLATLKKLLAWRESRSGLDAYGHLEMLGQRLQSALIHDPKVDRRFSCQRVGSMFTIFFHGRSMHHPIQGWSDLSEVDGGLQGPYAALFRHLRQAGIIFPPSQFEAAFISLAHTVADIDKTAVEINRFLRGSCV